MSDKRFKLSTRQYSKESGEYQYESDNSEAKAVKQAYEMSPDPSTIDLTQVP